MFFFNKDTNEFSIRFFLFGKIMWIYLSETSLYAFHKPFMTFSLILWKIEHNQFKIATNLLIIYLGEEIGEYIQENSMIFF